MGIQSSSLGWDALVDSLAPLAQITEQDQQALKAAVAERAIQPQGISAVGFIYNATPVVMKVEYSGLSAYMTQNRGVALTKDLWDLAALPHATPTTITLGDDPYILSIQPKSLHQGVYVGLLQPKTGGLGTKFGVTILGSGLKYIAVVTQLATRTAVIEIGDRLLKGAYAVVVFNDSSSAPVSITVTTRRQWACIPSTVSSVTLKTFGPEPLIAVFNPTITAAPTTMTSNGVSLTVDVQMPACPDAASCAAMVPACAANESFCMRHGAACMLKFESAAPEPKAKTSLVSIMRSLGFAPGTSSSPSSCGCGIDQEIDHNTGAGNGNGTGNGNGNQQMTSWPWPVLFGVGFAILLLLFVLVIAVLALVAKRGK